MRNCCGLLILFAVVYGAQSSPDVSELQEKKTAENAATSSNETISKDITHPSITTPAITTHNITTPTTTPQPTTIPTHPTTTKPNTITTAKPTTTTTKPNTTTPATTTTTPQPTTTSTTKPTTTSKPAPPKPVPNPEENHWILNITGTNRTCLVLNVAAQIELPINGTNSTQKINIPSHNVTYSGTCSTDKNSTVVLQSNLAVMWQSNTSNTNYSIFFEFSRNHSKYDISAIKADIIEQATNASNPTTKTLYHNKQEFTVSEGKSYRCAKVQTLNFTDGQSNATVGWLHVSHLQYQAFVNRTDDKFESAWDCESSGNNSDVVPIVVGCVLMVLILVILAAYIIGRRRWNARGYLSM